MNLMPIILSDSYSENTLLNEKIDIIRTSLKENKIRITEKFTPFNETLYFYNALPYIPENRDVLKKANNICTMYVNWKKLEFTGISTTDIINKKLLKKQFGWNISIVDKDHTRNNYKNKQDYWVIFDSYNIADKYLKAFNNMFRTAIEQDAIDEYKKFKINPLKYPLTYDKLIPNAYELYDEIDKGLI